MSREAQIQTAEDRLEDVRTRIARVLLTGAADRGTGFETRLAELRAQEQKWLRRIEKLESL